MGGLPVAGSHWCSAQAEKTGAAAGYRALAAAPEDAIKVGRDANNHGAKVPEICAFRRIDCLKTPASRVMQSS
ncbi:MAG: hypothetical protein ACK6D0_10530 [Planctomyces sp.]|jgi:hypothetical protein